jgi:hypothetical protein
MLNKGLRLFSRNKNICEECKEKFDSYGALIAHARHAHHRTILKCTGCGKEFIHEKDRLHHVREEQIQKAKSRYQ